MKDSRHFDKLKRKWAWAWLIFWYSNTLLFLKSDSQHHLEYSLKGPSLEHPFGFDSFGRDLAQIILKASLTSSSVSLGVVAISTFTALILGASISFAPKALRYGFLRLLETLIVFPSLLFALTYAAIHGPGWDTLNFALLIGILPSFTRLIYLRTREILVEDYTLAAQSMGAGPVLIFKNHLLPALLSLCSIKIPNLFAHALLAEATLSFLGVGAPIGSDTWGSALFQGKEYLLENPHIALGSGIPLVFTVLSLQFLSESNSSITRPKL